MRSEFTPETTEVDMLHHCALSTRALVAVEPHRPPVTNVYTGTAFRHDQCKHFQESKHLLRLEVS